MKKLVLQIIIKQWDKSQLTAQHVQQRQAVSDRYMIGNSARGLSDQTVLLDQHGDDVMGNRIQFQLTDKDFFIDRFRFNLEKQTVEFKSNLQPEAESKQLAILTNGWLQCHYHWRYRIEEGGFIYWLYEDFTLNACFVESVDELVFMNTPAEQVFRDLLF